MTYLLIAGVILMVIVELFERGYTLIAYFVILLCVAFILAALGI